MKPILNSYFWNMYGIANSQAARGIIVFRFVCDTAGPTQKFSEIRPTYQSGGGKKISLHRLTIVFGDPSKSRSLCRITWLWHFFRVKLGLFVFFFSNEILMDKVFRYLISIFGLVCIKNYHRKLCSMRKHKIKICVQEITKVNFMLESEREWKVSVSATSS